MKFNLMDEYVPLGDTRYVFRISKVLTFLNRFSHPANIHSHSVICTSLSLAKINQLTFIVIRVHFLRYANKKCECIYQSSKNVCISIAFTLLLLNVYCIGWLVDDCPVQRVPGPSLHWQVKYPAMD